MKRTKILKDEDFIVRETNGVGNISSPRVIEIILREFQRMNKDQ